MDISIIIPVYNEELGIENTLENIFFLKLNENYEIIIVDDGSSDNTNKVIKKYPVKLITHNINKGYGAALKTGIRKASRDKVIILDGDGQHNPSDIEKISVLLYQYDMVIGERSSGSFQVKHRQPGKKIIKLVGEFLVEQELPDFNSGFRGFQRNLISKMLHIMPNGFSFSTTSTLAFLKEGYTIGTFPIIVKERKGRRSNVKFLKDGSKTILLIFRIIMLFNPLKVFFPASIIVSFIGFLWGIYGYIIASRVPNSSIIIMTLGIFIFFLGLIGDQIALLNRKE